MYDTELRTNPFPGLRSFEQDEEYLFFGRERQIDELLKKLRTTRFLSVIGASGSGKSSLVKSGLLPSLYSGYMTTAGSSWKVALFRPGDDPIGNLAKVLSEDNILYQHDGDEAMYSSIIEATLRRSRLGLYEAVRQSSLTTEDNLLVIVDQFEELFRYSKYEKELHGEKSGSQSFINLLLNAVKSEDSNIYVCLTMRSDFLGDCTQFRDLPEAINEGQYLIPRMTRDNIKQAIVGPVAVGGGEITPRLLTRLLNDVGDSPDQLPILQHALMRTWDFWEQNHKEGEPIDMVHYEAIGSMSKALSLHAEEAMSDLPNDHIKSLAESMFKSLTDHGSKGQGIRRPTKMGEICELAEADPDEIRTIVESFRKRGRSLLMPPVGTPLHESTIIDISHESLMRVWTRLKIWDEEENNSAETYKRLASDAALYQEGKMGLLSGPELELALKWKEDNNPNQKWAQRYNPSFERAITYLEHSKRQNEFEIAQKEIEQKKRLARARRTILIFAAAAIISLFLSLFAFQQREEANAQRSKAEKNEDIANDALDKAKAEEQRAKEAKDVAEAEKERAVKAEQRAQDAKAEAEYEAQEAKKARKVAELAKKEAEVQKDQALVNLSRAKEAESKANQLVIEKDSLRLLEEQAKIEQIALREKSEEQERKTQRLKNLSDSRTESYLAIQEINEKEVKKGATRALEAHKLNVANKGPEQNSSNYEALMAALNGLKPQTRVLNEHKHSIRGVTAHPKQNILASGDENGTVVISKFTNGEFSSVGKVKAPGSIRSITFSNDGDYLLTASFNKQLTIWNGNQLGSKNPEKIIEKKYPDFIKAIACVSISGEDYALVSTGNNLLVERIMSNGLIFIDSISIENVNVITLSKDQKILLIGSGNSIYEYSLNDSPTLANPEITKLESQVMSLAISDDKKYIGAGLLNGRIYVEDLENENQQRKYFTEHYSRVSSINFNDLGDRVQLITTGFDKNVKILDLEYVLYGESDPGEDKLVIEGHDKWIHSGIFSNDGEYFLTVGEDNKLKSWYTTSKDLAETVERILKK